MVVSCSSGYMVLYFAFGDLQQSCPHLSPKLGSDRFKFDHLPHLTNNSSTCWWEGSTVRLSEHNHVWTGVFWFCLCNFFCREDGASSLFFFLFWLKKCWYSECIFRVRNKICPFKGVLLVTGQIFCIKKIIRIYIYIYMKYGQTEKKCGFFFLFVFFAKKGVVNANDSFLIYLLELLLVINNLSNAL